ncbi:2851_t:CDS:2, partial [Acaulospora colombiana]
SSPGDEFAPSPGHQRILSSTELAPIALIDPNDSRWVSFSAELVSGCLAVSGDGGAFLQKAYCLLVESGDGGGLALERPLSIWGGRLAINCLSYWVSGARVRSSRRQIVQIKVDQAGFLDNAPDPALALDLAYCEMTDTFLPQPTGDVLSMNVPVLLPLRQVTGLIIVNDPTQRENIVHGTSKSKELRGPVQQNLYKSEGTLSQIRVKGQVLQLSGPLYLRLWKFKRVQTTSSLTSSNKANRWIIESSHIAGEYTLHSTALHDQYSLKIFKEDYLASSSYGDPVNPLGGEDISNSGQHSPTIKRLEQRKGFLEIESIRCHELGSAEVAAH